jgi:hypothetical protein
MIQDILSVSPEADQNYLAVIVRIDDSVRMADNCDRMQLVTVNNRPVLVDMSVKEGDIMVYVPYNCVLSESFLRINNQYSKSKYNESDEENGYFSFTRRTQSIKLRGNNSEGFLCSFRLINRWLEKTGYPPVPVSVGESVGTVFDTVYGQQFVEKYVHPKKGKEGKGNAVKTPKELNILKKIMNDFPQIIPEQLHMIPPTTYLDNNMEEVSPDTWIEIPYKIHGTSAQSSRVMSLRKMNPFLRLLGKTGFPVRDTFVSEILTSRKCIKYFADTENENRGYYGEFDTPARKSAHDRIISHIHEGMSVYYEIAGYVEGTEIPWQRVGDTVYDYGCMPGSQKIFVFRITLTMPDGYRYTFPYRDMKEWCYAAGVDAVPLMYEGLAGNLYQHLDRQKHWNRNFVTELSKDPSFYMEEDCFICSRQTPPCPAEGIVIRPCHLDYRIFKMKTKRFLTKENGAIESGKIYDLDI